MDTDGGRPMVSIYIYTTPYRKCEQWPGQGSSADQGSSEESERSEQIQVSGNRNKSTCNICKLNVEMLLHTRKDCILQLQIIALHQPTSHDHITVCLSLHIASTLRHIIGQGITWDITSHNMRSYYITSHHITLHHITSHPS